ncbi:cytoplasmic dynein 2 light intermediate chain 1-like isoform X1 [Haliotis rubra]|uniref:cytoplasmic dynein 2 light intermediate chain 1-like isoform X1 n=1 Tax=Haliotis rubra TaxID=36100 RepID=UPI001EE575FA|nr:cytoplasmic dynein 2 light intermediate chain 1-like isoform X1 [Haliotis rubra]
MSKSLWNLAIDQANTVKDENQASEDSAIFITGSKNSGKTSIILRYLDRDEPPKPTVALEYTFGRRAKGHNIAKDVGHIWELGGGTWLSKLMDIPINPETIMHTGLVIVLDLSTPKELWFTLESLLTSARSRVENVIAEMKQADPHIRDKLKKMAWERIGEEHPDKSMIDPFLVPLVIVGSKYDVFQDFDSEKRKVICKTLRFVAHSQGATLQFFSIKMEGTIKRMQGIINHHLFRTNPSKNMQVEHNKPLFVPAGLDSLQTIGNPPISDDDIGRVHARTPMELWKQAFTGHFPQEVNVNENTNNPAIVEDPAKDPQFVEAAIDTLRAQKDEELERYRRLAERRSRETTTY